MQDSLLQLTVGMVATLAGSGHITCSIDLLIFLLAQISGSGSVKNTSLLQTMAQLSSTLHGSGTITQAQIKTLALMIADILGVGNVNSTLFGTCDMSADITSAGELVTAQSCAQAVWSALSAAFNDPGTMGNKMNSASAAGDPWSAEIPGNYADGSAGKTLSNITEEGLARAILDALAEDHVDAGTIGERLKKILANTKTSIALSA